MKIYNMDTSNLEDVMTEGIHIFCDHLADEGIIDEKLSEELQTTRIVVIRKPSKVSSFLAKIFNKSDNYTMFIATLDPNKPR